MAGKFLRCAGAAIVGGILLVAQASATPPQASFGFNGTVSGFPSGAAFLTGGGVYDLASGFVHSAGGFRCLEDVEQGPLAGCLAGEGIRWDTGEVLESATFKCTGSANEAAKIAMTSDRTAVLESDFYRAGDGVDESFTAQLIVSSTDIAPDIDGFQNLWIQGVGCGTAILNFR
jgi:hypothetical protein